MKGTFKKGNLMLGLKFKSSLLISLTLFGFVMLCSSTAFSKGEKINVQMNVPEWNGKQFCDEGKGVNLDPINAPGISISLEPNVEVEDNYYFNFVWEKRINNGSWQTSDEGKNVTLVPAMEPGRVENDDSIGNPMLVSWRLKIQTVGSTEWFTSDVYEATITAPLSVTYNVITRENKCNIDLHVRGGLATKTYAWTSQTRDIKFPESQKNVRNPEGLAQGVYQVVVKDECQEKKYIVDTQDNTSKK